MLIRRRTSQVLLMTGFAVALTACSATPQGASDPARPSSAGSPAASSAAPANSPQSVSDVLSATAGGRGATFTYSDSLKSSKPGEPDTTFVCAGRWGLGPASSAQWTCKPSKALAAYMVGNGVAPSAEAMIAEYRKVGNVVWVRYPNAADSGWLRTNVEDDEMPCLKSSALCTSPALFFYSLRALDWQTKSQGKALTAVASQTEGSAVSDYELRLVVNSSGRIVRAQMDNSVSNNGATVHNTKTLQISAYGAPPKVSSPVGG